MLGDTGELIDEREYPTTTKELVDDHGDRTLELEDCEETLGEVLGRLEPETFERPEEARHAVYSALPSSAVGRKGYSDRDPVVPGSLYGPEEVSF